MPHGAEVGDRPTRGSVYARHLRSAAVTGVEIVAVAAALWLVGWLIGELWVILLPVVLAIIVCTVLWPPVRWLRSRGVPPAGAVLLVLLVAALVIAGVVAAIVPWSADGAVVAHDLTDALRRAADLDSGLTVVMGGEQIYAAAMPFADLLIVTEIDVDVPGGDAFAPAIDATQWRPQDDGEWTTSEKGPRYRFRDYRRIES